MFNFFNNNLIKIVFLLFFLFNPGTLKAATLSISPDLGIYMVGSTITVNVLVSSEDSAMNAASAIISFPKDLLSVSSIVREDSILALKPTFSNTAGIVNFESVLLPPGFIGISGNLLTIVFKAKASGVANVTFASSSVLAADGMGTDILTSTNGASFQIIESIKNQPLPLIPSKAAIEGLEAPIITDCPSTIQDGSPITVKGKTKYSNSRISLSLKDEGGKIITFLSKADNKGDFIVTSNSGLKNGIYKIFVQVGDDTEISPYSREAAVDVKQITFIKIKSQIINYRAVTIIFIVLALLFIICYRLCGSINTKKELKKEVHKAENILHGSLHTLKKDFHGKAGRENTQQFDNDLKNIESEIENEIEDIKELIDK